MAERNLDTLYDVVVIGGGPAGLTAALYLARARYRVVVVEKESFGGQITITSEVVNYPGVASTSGTALTETMRQQAEHFGAEFLLAEVESLSLEDDVKEVKTTAGTLSCFGVVVACGAHPRMIGFPGEAEFRGRGVAYCATCDGEFFTGLEVFVVGGGFAAAEEAVFLTKYASHVTILIREEDFTCAKAVADPARNHPKITVLTNTEVKEVKGDSALRSITYRQNVTGEETTYQAPAGKTFGVFVFAGYQPASDLVKGLVELNPQDYLVTDRNQKTSVDGVYGAGDICVKNLRQVVTAVGDGATAATELEHHCANMQKKTGLHPVPPTSRPIATPEEELPQKQPSGGLFDEQMLAQLNTVFGRMEQNVELFLYLNDTNVSRELEVYMQELVKLTDKLSLVKKEPPVGMRLPCVELHRADGTYTGLSFHGVPGGHEFTSFVLGIYNTAGPGQPLDEESRQRIVAIGHPIELQIFVSLSCTMCPELVAAAQRIAAIQTNVTAEVYDLNHFPELKEQYQVMSVPCMVMNGVEVTFGKKNVKQILDFIGA